MPSKPSDRVYRIELTGAEARTISTALGAVISDVGVLLNTFPGRVDQKTLLKAARAVREALQAPRVFEPKHFSTAARTAKAAKVARQNSASSSR